MYALRVRNFVLRALVRLRDKHNKSQRAGPLDYPGVRPFAERNKRADRRPIPEIRLRRIQMATLK